MSMHPFPDTLPHIHVQRRIEQSAVYVDVGLVRATLNVYLLEHDIIPMIILLGLLCISFECGYAQSLN